MEKVEGMPTRKEKRGRAKLRELDHRCEIQTRSATIAKDLDTGLQNVIYPGAKGISQLAQLNTDEYLHPLVATTGARNMYHCTVGSSATKDGWKIARSPPT